MGHFFDYLNIQFEYEPEWDEVDVGPGIMYYKPDFYLLEQALWIEVKPLELSQLTFGANAKLRGWSKDYDGILLLVGPPSIPRKNTERHYYINYYEKKNSFSLQDKCGGAGARNVGRFRSKLKVEYLVNVMTVAYPHQKIFLEMRCPK